MTLHFSLHVTTTICNMTKSYRIDQDNIYNNHLGWHHERSEMYQRE